VLLLGNLLMAPFWRKRLALSGGATARATANRTVRIADMLFTLPGWIITLVTGIMLSVKGGWQGGWLYLSILLFVIWIVVWHVGTLRARKAMITRADEAAASGQTPPELEQHEQQWQQWSYISAGILLLVLILMVTTPF
jgi:uncharacterized membrane protein